MGGMPPEKGNPMPTASNKARSVGLRDISTPKAPLQDRSKDRVERVLDAAEALVDAHGAGQVTMQMISRESGVGRASVYQFFPSIHAVWKALALRYLADLQSHLEAEVLDRAFAHWSEVWDALVDAAVEYYNANPRAQSILLGSDGTQELRTADPEYDRRYAEWIAETFEHLAELGPELDVEHLRINVTCTTSLFSLSVWEHGRITPFYADEIKRITKAYTNSVIAASSSG